MPQPIDFQTELGRVSTVERVQQVLDRMSMLAQQRLAHDNDQQQAIAENQVAQTKPKSGEVEPELKRKNPYVGRRHKNERADTEQEDPPQKSPPQPPPEQHALDVTI